MPYRPRGKKRPLKIRFEEFYRIDPSGCWIWIGAKFALRNPKTGRIYGYRPTMAVNRRTELAYRISYRLYRGEIPPGAFVCHGCDNGMCVNPDHLWLGDNQKNQEDKKLKGRGGRGEANNHAKLTVLEVGRIRMLRSVGYPLSAIAEEFGVTVSTVSAIANRTLWTHVD